MKELLIAIEERLGAVPSLRYVGENSGQLNSDRPPVQFPCALIDIDSIKWSDVSELHQKGECDMHITISNVKMGNTSLNATQGQKDIGFHIYEIVEQVHNVLHGWIPLDNGCSILTRKSMKKIDRKGNIQEYCINYALVINDKFADRYEMISDIEPVIKVKFIRPTFD